MQKSHFTPWIATFFIAALAGCSTLPNASRLAYQGSTVSLAHRAGNPPTVVFQSGLGDGMAVWSAVFQRLPSDMGTFAYDRPGNGDSSSKAGDRDPCSIARELHEMLRVAEVRPPYVLVGHSLGGLYQYVFAKLYPNEVGGILLLDATHPEHWEHMQRRTPNTAAVVRGLRAVAFSDTEKREFDAQAICISGLQKKDTSPYSARLLLRGKADPLESAEFQAMSRELASNWSELLPGLTKSRIEGAAHYIQKDKPELVAAEIVVLVSAAQANRR